jgi:hypothetical protein
MLLLIDYITGEAVSSGKQTTVSCTGISNLGKWNVDCVNGGKTADETTELNFGRFNWRKTRGKNCQSQIGPNDGGKSAK